MRYLNTFGFLLLIVIVLVLNFTTVEKAEAIWHGLLYETVNDLWGTWPWSIAGHPWVLVPSSGYQWGIVHEIYHSTLNDQSLWCAGLLNGGITNLTPFIDQYPTNMHKKMVWGPFSLATAVEAECNFFYWNDTQFLNDYLLWGASLTQTAAVVYEGGRASGLNTTGNWSNSVFHFSELVSTAGDTVSLLGYNQVYLVFLFHSDGYLGAWGSFVDDIALGWDDGLFDLEALATEFVQIAGEDTNIFSEPVEGQEYYLRFLWEAEGEGTTPMFDMDCEIDGNPYYHERTSITVPGDTFIYTYTDQLWSGSVGPHLIEWTIDTNDEVVESYENNNYLYFPFDVVIVDSLPWIIVTRPTEGDSAHLGFWIQWEDYDRESDASIWIYYDTDNLGYNGTSLTPTALSEDSDEDSLWWNTSALNNIQYYVYAIISDGVNSVQYDYSDYPVQIYHPNSVNNPNMPAPVDFLLERNYPNPFNGATSIAFSTPEEALIDISIYDVNGRLVENLFKGEKTAGRYTLDWNPSAGSGVYFCHSSMIGLKSGKKYSMTQKMLYIQ